MTEHFVSERFRRAVSLHITKNLAADYMGPVPLLLGIHGPSGEGKTFQCDLILRELQAEVFMISGGQLESKEAGEPAQLLRRAYLDAGRAIKSGKARVAAVVINDIDTGVGDWGNMVQYTVNRQAVFGELMHFVDYPTKVEGQDTKRVPIIITGNDFTRLYEPLVRAGRMTSFLWKPNIEEKIEIAARIFPEILRDEVTHVVTELERIAREKGVHRVPVSFLPHLRSTLIDGALWKAIEGQGVVNIIEMISRGFRPRFGIEVSASRLLAEGAALVESGKLTSHLGRDNGDHIHFNGNENIYQSRVAQDTNTSGVTPGDSNISGQLR
jgi:hypothetical protein